jgi:hypothetical protein
MPLYYSSHTTACLTKQALRGLMEELLASRPVSVRRAVASQLAGRMILECEAQDQRTLEQFLAARNITSEWVMRIDLDAHDGIVMEP